MTALTSCLPGHRHTLLPEKSAKDNLSNQIRRVKQRVLLYRDVPVHYNLMGCAELLTAGYGFPRPIELCLGMSGNAWRGGAGVAQQVTDMVFPVQEEFPLDFGFWFVVEG